MVETQIERCKMINLQSLVMLKCGCTKMTLALFIEHFMVVFAAVRDWWCILELLCCILEHSSNMHGYNGLSTYMFQTYMSIV